MFNQSVSQKMLTDRHLIATPPSDMLATVADRLANLRKWQHQLAALADERLIADDADRLERATLLIEANLLVARRHLESEPPEDIPGVTLLLRYGLSITEDPCLAAVIKSCLVTLLGIARPPDTELIDEIPDEVFDTVSDWHESGQGRA